MNLPPDVLPFQPPHTATAVAKAGSFFVLRFGGVLWLYKRHLLVQAVKDATGKTVARQHVGNELVRVGVLTATLGPPVIRPADLAQLLKICEEMTTG